MPARTHTTPRLTRTQYTIRASCQQQLGAGGVVGMSDPVGRLGVLKASRLGPRSAAHPTHREMARPVGVLAEKTSVSVMNMLAVVRSGREPDSRLVVSR